MAGKMKKIKQKKKGKEREDSDDFKNMTRARMYAQMHVTQL